MRFPAFPALTNYVQPKSEQCLNQTLCRGRQYAFVFVLVMHQESVALIGRYLLKDGTETLYQDQGVIWDKGFWVQG